MTAICILFGHEIILTILIIFIGGFAGLINYYKNSNSITDDKHWSYFVLSGIGAAILVPLFLNMLSSNLIRYNKEYDSINYFVFAGFCFIAGYFSNKFIESIGDKLLRELQTTKDKVEVASSKLDQTSREFLDNIEKIDTLIETESDVEELVTEDSFQFEDDNLKAVLQSFKQGYKFRTVSGISKELELSPLIVEESLQVLELQQAVKKMHNSKGSMIWSLTRQGQSLLSVK